LPSPPLLPLPPSLYIPPPIDHRDDILESERPTRKGTVLIAEEEGYASREAWAHAIGLSQAVHYELQTHCE
ncbi:hypothetical protein Tco_0636659, partial [Tanacetum coccineum]